MTDVAGDVAVNVVNEAVTAENIEYASQHATKENAIHAYDGACWANNKADELGIDKVAVAEKAGNAALVGGKALYGASSGVNWGKVANNVSEANK